MGSLQWRHNGRDSVSNHQPHDCLLKRLFRNRSKKISKLLVTGLCAGNSPVAGEIPAQMASNAGNVSIWWRHHRFWTKTITRANGCQLILHWKWNQNSEIVIIRIYIRSVVCKISVIFPSFNASISSLASRVPFCPFCHVKSSGDKLNTVASVPWALIIVISNYDAFFWIKHTALAAIAVTTLSCSEATKRHSKTRFFLIDLIYCYLIVEESRVNEGSVFTNTRLWIRISKKKTGPQRNSIHWSRVLNREWKGSWSSTEMRCFCYIWVINNFIVYYGATYIRGLTVAIFSEVVPRSLGRWHFCPGAREVTLTDVGKFDRYQATTKHESHELCTYFLEYWYTLLLLIGCRESGCHFVSINVVYVCLKNFHMTKILTCIPTDPRGYLNTKGFRITSIWIPMIKIRRSHDPWWRHRMETYSASLALCAGNSPLPVNSPHKGQWRGALIFSLICAWMNDWISNREAGD